MFYINELQGSLDSLFRAEQGIFCAEQGIDRVILGSHADLLMPILRCNSKVLRMIPVLHDAEKFVCARTSLEKRIARPRYPSSSALLQSF